MGDLHPHTIIRRGTWHQEKHGQPSSKAWSSNYENSGPNDWKRPKVTTEIHWIDVEDTVDWQYPRRWKKHKIGTIPLPRERDDVFILSDKESEQEVKEDILSNNEYVKMNCREVERNEGRRHRNNDEKLNTF